MPHEFLGVNVPFPAREVDADLRPNPAHPRKKRPLSRLLGVINRDSPEFTMRFTCYLQRFTRTLGAVQPHFTRNSHALYARFTSALYPQFTCNLPALYLHR